MRIFISGAAGALGQEMAGFLSRQGVDHLATDINDLDVTDFKKTHDMLVDYNPDVILHFAAKSDVDNCEEDPETALRVNALSSLGFGIIANKINAKLLYTSTNFVFDGNTKSPYEEHSDPNPINTYGRTKLLGENYILDTCARSFIVRTSWLFGKYSRNFISRFLNSETKPSALDAVYDRCASFTYTVDLAKALFQVIQTDSFGIFHIVNSGEGSFMDFLCRAKEILKFQTEIHPIKADDLHLPATRPLYSPLASQRYEDLTGQGMRDWRDAITDFCGSLSPQP